MAVIEQSLGQIRFATLRSCIGAVFSDVCGIEISIVNGASSEQGVVLGNGGLRSNEETLVFV